MKKPSLALLLLFLCNFAFSQKPDIEKPKITYTQLPLKPLPRTVKKYDIKIVNTQGLRLPSRENLAANQLKIAGLEYAPGNGDVILLLMIDGVSTNTGTISKAMTTGGAAQFYYNAIAKLKARVSFLTLDHRTEYYVNSSFANDLRTTIESSNMYATDELAQKALVEDKMLVDRVVTQCIDQSLQTIGFYLNNNHGLTTKSEYLPVWTIKAKSHDYSDFDKAKDTYVQAMTQYNDPSQRAESKKKLQECADIWKKAEGEYNPNDKDARISSRNILELYMNLAMVNTWLENFDEAKKYFALGEKEKGLNGWKPVILDLINTNAVGFEQSQLREKDALTIEMTESPFGKAKDFLVTNSSHRIKYIEYYDELNPKRLKSRQVFKYDGYGMLTEVFSQDYNDVSKIFGDRKDTYTISYDNTEKVMSVNRENFQKAVAINTLKDGKLMKRQAVDRSSNSYQYEFNYGTDGKLSSYSRNGKKVSYGYNNGELTSVTTKSWFMNMKDSVFNNLRYTFSIQNNKKAGYDMYANNTASLTNFGEKRYSAIYTYDGKGNVVKIASPGQTFHYKYDEHGNLIETIISSDTTPIHYTYVWEEGSGNAGLFVMDLENPYRDPLFYPQIW